MTRCLSQGGATCVIALLVVNAIGCGSAPVRRRSADRAKRPAPAPAPAAAARGPGLESLTRRGGLPGPTVPEGFGVNIKISKWSERDRELLQEAGFRFVRIDPIWHYIEKKPGVYDFARASWQDYDALVETMNGLGVRVMLTMTGRNPLYDEGHYPYTQEGRRAFAAYCGATVAHYADNPAPVLWEIGNEPMNWGQHLPEHKSGAPAEVYAALAATALSAMRAADDDAFVTAGAIMTLKKERIDFLSRVNERDGLLSRLDAVSFHAYGDHWPELATPGVQRLRAMLSEAEADVPIYCGEMGYTLFMTYGYNGGKGEVAKANPGLRQITPHQQGSYLVRLYLTNLHLGIPLTIWYAWPDEGEDPNNHMHNYGIVTKKRDPKPAWHAARAMTHALRGFQLAERMKTARAHDWVLRLRRRDDVALVVWTEEGQPVRAPRAIDLVVEGEMTVYDLYGHRTDTLAPGAHRLVPTNEPKYLLGAAAASRMAGFEPGIDPVASPK